ncbi:MAG: 50S ribosomal protein L9, partial [Bacteroidetes bacterium]|nr:50S ribosomal protein L9 [Bacteroidota bacterium]
MEIILKEDIKGLGYKNDIITVKSGYGRNFLIPKGFAIIASESNTKMIQENIRQASHKAEKIKNDAEQLAASIGELELELKTKAGESGKIFGAITTGQISDALKEKGFDISRKQIDLKETVKNLGDYEATLDLHKEVEHLV